MNNSDRFLWGLLYGNLKYCNIDYLGFYKIFSLFSFMYVKPRCEIYKQMEMSELSMDTSKDEIDLYKLENFEDMLTHYDELLAQRLNTDYRAQELTFVKVKHTSKAMPKDLPPVDSEKRKKQVGSESSDLIFVY